MENASKALIIAGAILIALLLVGIGVLLISQGTDITKRGTSEMQSENIQSFNSKFINVEGIQKGSKIKGLVNTVNSINAADAAHQVTLVMAANTTTSAGANVTTIAGLTDTKNYRVTLSYAAANGNTVPAGTVLAGPGAPTTEQGYIFALTISDP